MFDSGNTFLVNQIHDDGSWLRSRDVLLEYLAEVQIAAIASGSLNDQYNRAVDQYKRTE